MHEGSHSLVEEMDLIGSMLSFLTIVLPQKNIYLALMVLDYICHFYKMDVIHIRVMLITTPDI